MIKPARIQLLLVLLGVLCVRPLILCAEEGSASQPPSSIRYTISLAGFNDHLLHIKMEIPLGASLRQVQLPVWNALYQVRDFSQYVNKVTATGRGSYVHALRVNGSARDRTWLELPRSGRLDLRFVRAPTPQRWGSGAAAVPPSFSNPS